MRQSPTGSFLKFVAGFVIFLSLSFGLTLAVTKYTQMQATQQQTAAAIEAMLK